MSNYELIREVAIEELDCELIEFRHKGSGARILHIANDDPEKLFCLAFQTLPDCSNGAPHILEHTVLCGSEKYPVRDPFFSMTRRSCNTFMNAMTGDDMTFYPAASQIEADFYNLLDVYIDAVFFPNLDELSFLQEGHRLEFEEGKLVYKGIVFNEMKGALASADARSWHRLSELLYPDTPYRYNSGGDPAVIPTLTYEGLLDFHAEYYAPSRCIFFSYGDLDLDEHLDYLDERVLDASSPLPPLPDIPQQPRFKTPVRATDTYPVSAEESTNEKAIALFAWLTCTPEDQLETLALSLLDLVLMGSDAAPLKLALIKSGLCKEAYGFIDPETADIPFILMLKGCDEGDGDKLEAFLIETLTEIAEKGIPQEQIEAALHQLEFGRTEILGDSGPFGLTLFRRTVPLLMQGADPEDGLQIHTLFAQLRKRFNLSTLIERYLLANTHLCRLVMAPDVERAKRELDAEQTQLAAREKGLTQAERAQIQRQAEQLEAQQEIEEDVDLLPMIGLDDLPKKARDYPLEARVTGDVEILRHTCFTNQVVHASVVYDLPALTAEDLPYVRLLASLLPEVGIGGRDYLQTLQYMQLYTADVGCSLDLHPQARDATLFNPTISLEGKALARNVDRLFPLLQEMATRVDFTDRERMTELLMQHTSSLENGLVHSAMRYATQLASASLTPAASISNRWYGLDYLEFVRTLAGQPPIERLVDLHQRLFTAPKVHLVVGADGETVLPTFKHQGGTFAPFSFGEVPVIESQGRLIASPVAFTARALATVPFSHPDSAALAVAAKLMNHKVLHTEIREKGGAYGGGASANVTSGSFSFYGYRDPHITSTLDAMQLAIDTIGTASFDARELDEAKLSVLQKLDTPLSPGSRAHVAYARMREGRSVEARQAYRDRILNLTGDEVAGSTSHLDLGKATTVVFAGQELFNRDNPGFPLYPTG